MIGSPTCAYFLRKYALSYSKVFCGSFDNSGQIACDLRLSMSLGYKYVHQLMDDNNYGACSMIEMTKHNVRITISF